MTSEIRVNKLTNRIGLSTVTFADSGIGVTVTGRIDPDTDSARDLGTTSVRWRNAYVDTYYGDGSNLTGITGTTINSNTDNYVITGTGTANTLRGESGVIITSDSELIVGMTAGGGATPDARLQVRGDTFAKAQIQVLSTHNDDNPASLQISKSRSSGNTILGDNDDIGQINFAGNDGNGYHNVGRIMVSSSGEGNGNDDLPTVMRFFTTANGGVSLAERLRITSAGRLGVGVASPVSILHLHESGSNGAPIIQFSNGDTGTTTGDGFAIGMADNESPFIYNRENTDLRIGTNNIERLRITSSGRFGLGTTSPDHIFEVEDNNSSIAVSRDGANAQLLFKSNSVAQAGQIQVSESSGGGVMQFFNKNTSGTLRECFRLSPTNRTVSFFQAGPSYPAGPSHDEQYYQFCNSFAYNWVMRLRNLTWGYGLRIDVADDSTREGLLIYSDKSGVNQSKASITMDGTYRSRNNTYTSYSDIKLKENIVDAGSQWDDIKGLKVRNFNFKIDDPSQKMIGVVAQELETVCPNLVRDIPDTEEKDGQITETGSHTKEVKYSILYMKAIKALQEAMTRIEKLESDNTALRARVTNLEGN